MSITLVSPRETELQKQVIELAESLRNLGWEFELYKQGARATHQKLLDEIRELKAKLAELERQEPENTCPLCSHQQNEVHVHCNNCGETYTIEYTKGTP